MSGGCPSVQGWEGREGEDSRWAEGPEAKNEAGRTGETTPKEGNSQKPRALLLWPESAWDGGF